MPLTQQVPPIARGYHYALLVDVSTDDSGPFAAGAVIVAQLRDYANGPIAGLLSTADGTLYRVDDHHLEIQAPAALTTGLGNTSAVIDFVRTDQGEPDYLGIALKLPVLLPVTQLGSTGLSGIGGITGAMTAIVSSYTPVTLARCARRSTTNAVTIAPIAIPSGAKLGVPSVVAPSPIALVVAPVALPAGAVVGTPIISTIAGLSVGPAVIASGVLVRAPVVGTAGSQPIAPAVIGSTISFGAPVIATAGALGIGPGVIASTAYFGSPSVATTASANGVTYSNNPVTYQGSNVTYG